VSQCAACHEKTRPADHFPGDCSTCHTQAGATGNGPNFNHAAAESLQCASCHEKNRPANHFKGDCSGCHTQPGVTWKGAKFNHAGVTQYAGCHESRRPVGHYQGDCSNCHKNPGVTWAGAIFNHAAAGATNCVGCHASIRPTSHFQDQCSPCHNTTAWKPSLLVHTFPITHNGANSVCATCHPTMTKAYTCFACRNQAEETQKHADRQITFPTDCMKCHANGTKP
jgi:hypothetical protein